MCKLFSLCCKMHGPKEYSIQPKTGYFSEVTLILYSTLQKWGNKPQREYEGGSNLDSHTWIQCPVWINQTFSKIINYILNIKFITPMSDRYGPYGLQQERLRTLCSIDKYWPKKKFFYVCCTSSFTESCIE